VPLEFALALHGLIPEAVAEITSVTSSPTTTALLRDGPKLG